MYVHKKSVCTHNPLWYKIANTYTLALWKIYTSVSMYESNKYTLRYFISFTCVFTILISCVQCVSLFVHCTPKCTKCVQFAFNLHFHKLSDGVGFEPTVCYAYLSFQDWYLWPLRHPSCVRMCKCTNALCVQSTMHVYTRPDKGISIIWSLCVPYVANAQSVYNAYVCLCIPPPSAQSLYMCVHCVYNIFVVFAGIPLEAIRCLSLYSIALVR